MKKYLPLLVNYNPSHLRTIKEEDAPILNAFIPSPTMKKMKEDHYKAVTRSSVLQSAINDNIQCPKYNDTIGLGQISSLRQAGNEIPSFVRTSNREANDDMNNNNINNNNNLVISSSIRREPSYLPTPYVIPRDTVQNAFDTYHYRDSEQERQEMAHVVQASEMIRREGPLYKVYKQCCDNAKLQHDNDINTKGKEKREEDRDVVDSTGGDAFGPFWAAFNATSSSSSVISNDMKSDVSSASKPPVWFETMCRDLYFRTDSTAKTDNIDNNNNVGSIDRKKNEEELEGMPASSLLEKSPHYDANTDRTDNTEYIDPYLWLEFSLRGYDEYTVGRYTFLSEAEMGVYDTETKVKLCLGNMSKEYVCFCEGYRFPDRKQLPTSIGTEPCKLLVSPSDTVPTVYIQLSDHFPPALWLPVRPTAAAIRRVLSGFASASAIHRDAHHHFFEEVLKRSEVILRNSNLPTDPASILRYAAHDAGKVLYLTAPVKEHPNFQEFFVGEYDDPQKFIEYVQLCPMLFSLPHMRTDVDPHEEGMVPTIDGPGIAPSLFRSIYSKSLLMPKVHLSTEVKLPPQDLDSFMELWKDVQEVGGSNVPKSRIPVFIRVSWPDNSDGMSGGGKLISRFNKLFNTEMAPNMPIDAAMALFYIMQWSHEMPNFLGIRGMRRRLEGLLSEATKPQAPMLYPSTHDIPNPEYTLEERIGMHIQYLAHLGDPRTAEVIRKLLYSGTAPIRMGCAKAAMEIGDKELFHYITCHEPPGRMQHYMTKIVRKRKARDLTEKVPKLMDDQYEFGAPLWTRGRTVRLDPMKDDESVLLDSPTERFGK